MLRRSQGGNEQLRRSTINLVLQGTSVTGMFTVHSTFLCRGERGTGTQAQMALFRKLQTMDHSHDITLRSSWPRSRSPSKIEAPARLDHLAI